MIDRFIALIIVIILMPIIIIISLIIYIDDGFPIFFIQKRVGKNNILFNLYKFRTMRKFAPNVATHLLENPNKHILNSGKILRLYSLDELPNLFNIILGHMTFIGPRPALYNQKDLIDLRINAGVDVLMPGITGWAQVNGRDDISNKDKVNLDKEYLNKKSFFFDINIFFRTINFAFFRKTGIKH